MFDKWGFFLAEKKKVVVSHCTTKKKIFSDKKMETVETMETPGGNTKSPGESAKKKQKSEKKARGVPGKNWCFTWNNYPEDGLETLETKFQGLGAKYRIGKEVGELNDTPHLQGYLEAPTKIRPIEKFGIKEIHWEKAKGNREQNLTYCGKEGSFVGNLQEIYKPKMYGWQEEVVRLADVPCDRRSVYWFWEETGNVGKSDAVTWLVQNKEAVKIAGKAADMKFAVTMCKTPPEIIVMDIPRSAAGYVSYTGLEEVMGQVIASTKYESKMYVKNHSKVFVFANFEPNPGEEMSRDRFKVYHIREMQGFVGTTEQKKEDDFLEDCDLSVFS